MLLSEVKKTDESGLLELLKLSVFGMLSGVMASAALVLIAPLILVKLKDPEPVTVPAALAALYIGALICGFAVRRHGTVCALFSGMEFVLCLWIVSLTQSGEESVGLALRLLGYACCIAVSLLGSVIGKGSQIRIGEGKKSPTAKLRKQFGRRR